MKQQTWHYSQLINIVCLYDDFGVAYGGNCKPVLSVPLVFINNQRNFVDHKHNGLRIIEIVNPSTDA